MKYVMSEGVFIVTVALVKQEFKEALFRKGVLAGSRVLNRIITIFSYCCLLQLSISYDPGGS